MADDSIEHLLQRHALMEKRLDDIVADTEALVAKGSAKVNEQDQTMINKMLYRYKFLKRQNEAYVHETANAPTEASAVGDSDLNNGIQNVLLSAFEAAVKCAFDDSLGDAINEVDMLITVADKKKTSAQFQFNSAMKISAVLRARGRAMSPRDVADRIASVVQNEVVERLEVSGPGYINIFVAVAPLRAYVDETLRNGVRTPINDSGKHKVIVDFSSPNIAKDMHVGHLRSTIIGETISRLYERCGYNVLRLNHLGDWGTQFGMLIAHLADKYPDYATNPPPLKNLVAFYKESKKRFDEDEEFKRRAYDMVVKLQAYDPVVYGAWKYICELSREAYLDIYRRLDVTIIDRGESFYHELMPKIVEYLKEKNVTQLDEGRLLVWPNGFDVPLTVVKSDGGYTYDTSDLAAIRQRLDDEKADIILYVVDAGQGLHLRSIYQVAQQLGWYDPKEKLVKHVEFGLVLGEDNKKFKTRSGETVRLTDLLNEGVERARAKLKERQANTPEADVCCECLVHGKTYVLQRMTEEELLKAQESLAYGCIKYFDLSTSRERDYVFSYDRMLDDRGNTAVYLLYSYVRVRSMMRKARLTREQLNAYLAEGGSDKLGTLKVLKDDNGAVAASELALLCQLVRHGDAMRASLDTQAPHILCDYVYNLATQFASFYEECKVVELEKNEPVGVRIERLKLAEAVGDHLLYVFGILGIRPIEKM